MSITTLDGLIAGMQAGATHPIYKTSQSNAVSGTYHSLWRSGGGFPAQGAIPSTWATCDDTFTGTFPLPTQGASKLYVARLGMTTSLLSGYWLMDRLGAMGGLSGTVTTAQTVNATIATQASAGRCLATGDDVDWMLEWYTDTGSTAVTATVNVTFNDGTTGNLAAVSLVATTRAGRLYPLVSNVQGKTIKGVNTVTLSATTGTAGNFGVTAYKRLVEWTNPVANTSIVLDYAGTGLAEIKDSSCLSLVQITSTTTTGTQIGNIIVAMG